MSLSNDQVGHIARLARIALSDTELDATRAKLNGIFALIEQMQAVDTTGIEPMSHPQELPTRLRAASLALLLVSAAPAALADRLAEETGAD